MLTLTRLPLIECLAVGAAEKTDQHPSDGSHFIFRLQANCAAIVLRPSGD